MAQIFLLKSATNLAFCHDTFCCHLTILDAFSFLQYHPKSPSLKPLRATNSDFVPKPMKLKPLTIKSDIDSVTTFSSIEPFELPPAALSPDEEISERRFSTDLTSNSQSSAEESSESLYSTESGYATSPKEEDWGFQLPPAAILDTKDEVLRPSLCRKGSSLGSKQVNDEISANFMKFNLGSQKICGPRSEPQEIHPESILNFLKNCAAGQAKLIATFKREELSEPIRCGEF